MQNVGNDYQNTGTGFDLVIGVTGTTPPSSILGTTSATSDGGGGDGGGTSNPSALVCNDTAPGSAPVLFLTSTGTNTVTLSWSPAADPVSTYVVAYGTSPGAPLYGADVGNVTTYTVLGLSGNQTYYFTVRAGNGCAPGPFSNEVLATPTGVGIEGPAQGFAPNVLGEASESAQTSPSVSPTPEEGEIMGEQEDLCTNAWWWWLVIVFYIIDGIILLLLCRKFERGVKLLIEIFSTIVASVLLIYALCNSLLAVILVVVLGVIIFFLAERSDS